jgi:hypothetical protein
MRQLRRTFRARRLWIDAICIDQASPDEKNVQVAMMADIYGNAKKVVVWLGEGTKDTALVFRLLRTMELIEQPFSRSRFLPLLSSMLSCLPRSIERVLWRHDDVSEFVIKVLAKVFFRGKTTSLSLSSSFCHNQCDRQVQNLFESA